MINEGPFMYFSPSFFSPLSCPNQKLYWSAIHTLYIGSRNSGSFTFLEDAAIQVLKECVEEYGNSFTDEENTTLSDYGDAIEDNIVCKARMILNRLISCGWLEKNYDAIDNNYFIKFTPFANFITNAIVSFENKEDSLKIAENRRTFCQIVTELASSEKPKKDSLGAFEFPYRNGLLSLNDLLVSMIDDMCKIHPKQNQRIIDIYDKQNQQELIDIGIDYFFNDVNNGYINVMYEEGRIGDEWFNKLKKVLNKVVDYSDEENNLKDRLIEDLSAKLEASDKSADLISINEEIKRQVNVIRKAIERYQNCSHYVDNTMSKVPKALSEKMLIFTITKPLLQDLTVINDAVFDRTINNLSLEDEFFKIFKYTFAEPIIDEDSLYVPPNTTYAEAKPAAVTVIDISKHIEEEKKITKIPIHIEANKYAEEFFDGKDEFYFKDAKATNDDVEKLNIIIKAASDENVIYVICNVYDERVYKGNYKLSNTKIRRKAVYGT